MKRSIPALLTAHVLRFRIRLHIYFSQKQLPENIARALCDN